MTHCEEHLQVKLFELKGVLWDTLRYLSFHRDLVLLLFVPFFVLFGRVWIQKDGKMSRTGVQDVKLRKNR